VRGRVAEEGRAQVEELFAALADLVAYLHSLEAEFLDVNGADIARRIRELKGWVESLRESWLRLEDPARLEELAELVRWRPGGRGSYEYAPIEGVPGLLVAAVLKRGRLVLGGYSYTLGKRGKWIVRFAEEGGRDGRAGGARA
jgi:hypothetical protein